MSNSTSTSSVAIIGAGPAGLMAASVLSKAGLKVTVYDQMPSVGRKFLMAGRGGLNLTHSEPQASLLARYGAASEVLAAAIDVFSPQDLRNWSEGLGQTTFVGTSGRVFPKDLKASPLLRAWLRQLDGDGVSFCMRHRWQGWDEAGQLLFRTPSGSIVTTKTNATILAMGGASWPRLGSDGAWTQTLRGQGIQVEALKPANCGFVAPWSDVFGERFQGQPLKPIKVSFAGHSLQGEAMVTRQGLEGSVIYALSAAIRDAIEVKGEAILSLDLRPGLALEDLEQRLSAPRGSQTATNFLRKTVGLSPVAIGLLREGASDGALPVDAHELALLIKEAKVRLTSMTSIDRAISSAGGVDLQEINEHFMLKKMTGVFVAGEMLDWEAPTGGYLLQATMSTAVKAAEGVKRYLVF